MVMMQHMDKTKSTGILINKVKLMDKIDCEIETATMFRELYNDKRPNNQDWKYFNGKVASLQDLKQWIEDLE